jgi:hypothetical protein
MTSENYRDFAVASLNSTEGAKDLTDKVGLLIMAEAWLELAEQTTQLVSHEAEEAHMNGRWRERQFNGINSRQVDD